MNLTGIRVMGMASGSRLMGFFGSDDNQKSFMYNMFGAGKPMAQHSIKKYEEEGYTK